MAVFDGKISDGEVITYHNQKGKRSKKFFIWCRPLFKTSTIKIWLVDKIYDYIISTQLSNSFYKSTAFLNNKWVNYPKKLIFCHIVWKLSHNQKRSISSYKIHNTLFNCSCRNHGKNWGYNLKSVPKITFSSEVKTALIYLDIKQSSGHWELEHPKPLF